MLEFGGHHLALNLTIAGERGVLTPTLTGAGLLFPPAQIWCGVACSPPPANFPGFFANVATLARKAVPASPVGVGGPAYVWDGDAIIGINQDSVLSGPGVNEQPGDLALFRPATGRWTALPAVPGHPSLSVTPVWTGTELLALTEAMLHSGAVISLADLPGPGA